MSGSETDYLRRIAEALERIDETLADLNNGGILAYIKETEEEDE